MAELEHQARLSAADEAYLGSRQDLRAEILIARSEGRTYADFADSLGFTATAVQRLVRACPVADEDDRDG